MDRQGVSRVVLAQVLATLALTGCSSSGPGGGGANGAGGSAGHGNDPVCSGTAYTRTDVPGTALCLAGDASFECGWGKGNRTDGYLVHGKENAEKTQLTLSFPDDDTDTTFTDYLFSLLFGTGDADLVLEYQGSRTGDYKQVDSWATAVAGDQGVCSGTTASGNGKSIPIIGDAQ